MIKFASIRMRLTLWYIALLAITILAFSLFLYYQLQGILSEQIDMGIQVAASQLLVELDDSVNPPVLRPMSDAAAAQLLQSSFASRMVDMEGNTVADVGHFPDLPFQPQQGFETLEIDGVAWRIYTQRVETNRNEFDAWLQVGQSLNVLNDTQGTLFRLILLGLPAILLMMAYGGIFMANRALYPVDTITKAVQAIHATDMSQRIHYEGPKDELSRLTETLNSMLERLQAAFEAERRFTADASHELRTPLTIIKGQIGVTLSRQRSPEEYETALYQIQNETDRLIRLANDLLFLARLDAAPLALQNETVNLSDLLEAIIEQMRGIAEDKNIQLSANIPDAICIEGMTDHLIRLFLNLLDNALKYTPEAGMVSLSLEVEPHALRVIIANSGEAIAPEDLPHLFERFYRAGRERNHGGAGLGLPIAHQIARVHGALLEIESREPIGTKVTVSIPFLSSAHK